MRNAERARLFAPLFAALVASAWIVLWAWGAGPYARYVHHASWIDLPGVAALCESVPGGSVMLDALLHSAAWLLMIAAMMLPTVFPLLANFRRLTATRADRRVLLALLVSGYAAAWAMFGAVAHGVDAVLHQLAQRTPTISLYAWLLGAGVVGLAGVYQFSRIKYRCLDKCRSPLMFVMEHWSGRSARRDSFLMGVNHGAFCVGCCWTLMLLMFAVGTGSVGWMLALGAVMAAEKNLPSGRYIGKALGVGLIAWSGWIVLPHIV
ncbi:DUF2182 domain-containing protein [Caballeronia concitans]|uniref:Metal-binding integral membrane protein n=1 Tax=Caballeronia concitans TaxID=1777133 RepID=A0A658QV33_9BURK|nr:DUF2182 domain-containing protein [Caballeronia concitans]KIG10887.1 Protein of unknown function DUF2182, transmembrane, metal-binding protein [Burkholderia sp. MR1]SAL24222.1 metal-binding integral membrane protein [Caballeronia concitans]